MKSVSEAFSAVCKNKSTFPIRKVYYKRRYWDVGTSAYIYESSWTQVPDDQVANVNTVNHQLDSIILNEWKVSNVTINLKNTLNEWKESNTAGRFGIDSGSSFGYEPYLMKFQIRSGFSRVAAKDIRQGEIDLGSEEIVNLFTGLAVDYQADTISGVMQIIVEGLERFLLNGDAEGVSSDVSLETIGTGDGSKKDFITKYAGVFKINTVTVNSVAKTKGTDYDVSNLNLPTDGATINLAEAPALGILIKCSYTRWNLNQPVEDFISDLVSEAGIDLSSITDATLGLILNNLSYGSKIDFENGANSGLDISTIPGEASIDYSNASAAGTLFQDFNSGTLAGNGWAVTTGGFGYYSIDSGELKYDNAAGELSGSRIRKTFTNRQFGVWQFKVKISSGGAYDCIMWISDGDNLLTSNSIYVRLIAGGGAGIYIGKFVAGVESSSVYGFNSNYPLSTIYQTVTLARTPDLYWRVYVDGQIVFSILDSQGQNSQGGLLADRMILQLTGPGNILIDDIYVPSATVIASHESQTIDTISDLSSWGNLTVSQQSAQGVITYKTRSSADGISWDAWTSVSASNGINSAVKRYLQVQINFSFASSTIPSVVPILFGYTVQFSSTKVFVAMGNFSGNTCHAAIQELAKLSDFEWGINDDETFFFRARDANLTPDETFIQNQNLSEILYQKNGYDNLYSVVQASFGNFVSEAVAPDGSSTSALEIIGSRRIFSIGSGIIINQDTNIADGMAAVYLARLGVKKRRIRFKSKFYPQVELSDTLSVTFAHNPFNSEEPFLSNFLGKVIACRHDLEDWNSEFELEEIV